MNKIALWGYYGFGNVGDEALLFVTLNLLKGVKVNLFSGPQPSVCPSEKLAILDRNPKTVYRTTKESDAFVLGPGGLLHERTKAIGTDYHLFGPFLSRIFRKPYSAIGQQMGPFSRSSTIALVKLALKRAKFVTVRDTSSFENANKIGLKSTLSADLAFLIEPDEPSFKIKERILALPTPRFLFCPAVYSNLTPSPQHSSEIINYLLEKTSGSVILMPFFPVKDDNYIEQVSSFIPRNRVALFKSPIDWRDAFGAFTLVDFSLPMRLHAMIASSLACKPALPIPYFSKVPMIAKELGYDIMIEATDQDWHQKCDKFLNNLSAIGDKITLKVKEQKRLAEVTARLVEEFIIGINS